MGKSVIVNCAHCGEKITEITFAPGTQVLSHHCKVRRNYEHFLGLARKTKVVITRDGELHIYRA